MKKRHIYFSSCRRTVVTNFHKQHTLLLCIKHRLRSCELFKEFSLFLMSTRRRTLSVFTDTCINDKTVRLFYHTLQNRGKNYSSAREKKKTKNNMPAKTRLYIYFTLKSMDCILFWRLFMYIVYIQYSYELETCTTI